MFRQIHEKLTKERQLASEPCPPLLRLSPPLWKLGEGGGGDWLKRNVQINFCVTGYLPLSILFFKMLKYRYHFEKKVFWIRIQIGCIFSNFVDPDPNSEYGSGSKQVYKNKRLDWFTKIYHLNLELSTFHMCHYFCIFFKRSFQKVQVPVPVNCCKKNIFQMFAKNFYFNCVKTERLRSGIRPVKQDPDPNYK